MSSNTQGRDRRQSADRRESAAEAESLAVGQREDLSEDVAAASRMVAAVASRQETAMEASRLRRDDLRSQVDLVNATIAGVLAGKTGNAEWSHQDREVIGAGAGELATGQRAALEMSSRQEAQMWVRLAEVVKDMADDQARRRAAALERPGTDVGRLDEHLQRQRDDVERVAREAAESFRLARESQGARISAEQADFGRALAGRDAVRDVAAVAGDQARAAKDHQRELRMLAGAVQRQAEEIAARVDAGSLARVRDRLAATAPQVAALSDDAISRALQEGRRHEGKASREGVIRGQVFEELVKACAEKDVASGSGNLVGSRVEAGASFIAAERLRGMNNQKLTDGILARLDAETGRLKVFRVFEAKAGARAARQLSERTDELPPKGEKELVASARDFARAEALVRQVMERELLTGEEARAEIERRRIEDAAQVVRDEVRAARDDRSMDDRVAERVRQLREDQAEGGQLESTREYLSETTEGPGRLMLDGVAVEIERAARVEDLVVGVVPADVEVDKAIRLDVSRDELRAAARALEELLDEEV